MTVPSRNEMVILPLSVIDEQIRSCDSSKVNILKNNIPFWYGMLSSPAGGAKCGEIYFRLGQRHFLVAGFVMGRHGHCFGRSEEN
jgi:hypothetical protein